MESGFVPGCWRVVARTEKSFFVLFLFNERVLNGWIEVRRVSEVGNADELCFNDLGLVLEQEMFSGQEAESRCAIFTSNLVPVIWILLDVI